MLIIVFIIIVVNITYSVPVVLVGNKKDLHMDRVVTHEEGHKLAGLWNAKFLEASAKQNEVTLIKNNC